jgi:hypothetical protein
MPDVMSARGRRPRRRSVPFSPKVAREICERLAAGELWHRIAGKGRMPSYASLYVWKRTIPEFAEALAEALEIAADHRFERALAVAEGATSGTASADRLHVDTLKYHAAKLAPRKYGTKGEVAPARVQLIGTRFVRDPDGGSAHPVVVETWRGDDD